MVNNKSEEDLKSTFYRSDAMSYVQFYIPNEVAKYVVSEIGEIGLVQFVDVSDSIDILTFFF